jgi:PRD1 phage membrane DNA delivery
MGNLGKDVTYILGAIIGVAILALLVSRNATTVQLVKTGGQVFNQALGTALSPVVSGWNGGINGASSFGINGGLQ